MGESKKWGPQMRPHGHIFIGKMNEDDDSTMNLGDRAPYFQKSLWPRQFAWNLRRWPWPSRVSWWRLRGTKISGKSAWWMVATGNWSRKSVREFDFYLVRIKHKSSIISHHQSISGGLHWWLPGYVHDDICISAVGSFPNVTAMTKDTFNLTFGVLSDSGSLLLATWHHLTLWKRGTSVSCGLRHWHVCESSPMSGEPPLNPQVVLNSLRPLAWEFIDIPKTPTVP